MTRFARFMQKVTKETRVTSPHVKTPCWIWEGSRSGSGYGQFWNGHRSIPAHWFLIVDFMPPGKEACHHCDNKLCVNPDHVFISNRAGNMRDCVAKGRLRPQNGCHAMLKVRVVCRGESNHAHKLTRKEVDEIRSTRLVRGTRAAMARFYGVSATVIGGIVSGKRWKD